MEGAKEVIGALIEFYKYSHRSRETPLQLHEEGIGEAGIEDMPISQEGRLRRTRLWKEQKAWVQLKACLR